MSLGYQIIKDLAEQRRVQLGCPRVYLEVKELVVSPGEVRVIEGNGDSYYINEIDNYVTIESDNGFYDLNSPIFTELINLHTGRITLSNNIDSEQRVKFIIVSYIKDN